MLGKFQELCEHFEKKMAITNSNIYHKEFVQQIFVFTWAIKDVCISQPQPKEGVRGHTCTCTCRYSILYTPMVTLNNLESAKHQ